jgi:hypothetical protein
MMRLLTELFPALFDNEFAQTALPAISPTLKIVRKDVVEAFLIRLPFLASKFDNPMTPDIGRFGARFGIEHHNPIRTDLHNSQQYKPPRSFLNVFIHSHKGSLASRTILERPATILKPPPNCCRTVILLEVNSDGNS